MQANTFKLRSTASFIVLLPVHAYRKLVSPLLGPRCKYYPTCSSYAVDAVKQYGALRGTVLAAWRVVRCNPMSDGGFDYVEDQRLFRRQPVPSASAKAHKHGNDCAHAAAIEKSGVIG